MLSLQDRTIIEVRQAGGGRRLLRVAASALFAELAAPGLLELFADPADDLDVELSSHHPLQFESLLRSRAGDAAIRAVPRDLPAALAGTHFLNYQMVAVVAPDHILTRLHLGLSVLREQTWLLGPSAASETGAVPDILRRVVVPEDRQRIFQSEAAAVEEAKRGRGLALAVAFAVSQDLVNGDLVRLPSIALQAQGAWS